MEQTTQSHGESTILDLCLALARHRRLVLGLPLLVALASALIAVLMPNWYAATAKIMPPQQSQSNAVAILGQLGALAGAGGASQALGLKNPSDIYVAMLKSRTVADSLIDRFGLKRIYDEDFLVDTRKALARNSSISAARDGVITIEVEDKDPSRAAAIANAYVEELRDLTLHLAVGEAGQRRLFFEGQLGKVKGDLANAEVALRTFAEKSGIVNAPGQVGMTVAAAASLKAQIAAKEIQLSAMRTFATDNNPDVKRTNQELIGLRGELEKLEKTASSGKGDVLVTFDKAPATSLEYLRRYRDVKYHETLFEVLAKQYEIAKIDEAKDATLIQVLDKGLVPERKSRPTRSLIVAVSTIVALLIAVIAAWILEIIIRAKRVPLIEAQMNEIRGAMRLPWRDTSEAQRP
jgi:tyrosine-protein kinase Etk/Wzc